MTFAQAIQNSIESILSVIPGYNGPLPSAATTDPEAVLTASSAPQTVAGKALAASSVKQPGTAKSVAEHVKAAVAEATDSKGGDSAK